MGVERKWTWAPQCGHRGGCQLLGNCGQDTETVHQFSPSMTFADSSDAHNATGCGEIQSGSSANTQVESPTRRKPGTDSRWEKLCPRCDEWVGIGSKQYIYPFLVHHDGEQCRKITQVKARAWVEEVLKLLFVPVTESSFDETSPQPYLDPPTAVPSPRLSPLSGLPSLVLPEGSLCVPPTAPDTMSLGTPQAPTSPLNPATFPLGTLPQEHTPPTTSSNVFVTSAKIPCYGAQVNWECGHASKTYPFQYHDMGYTTWSVSTQCPPDIDVLYLRFFSCTLFHDPSMEACFECLKLPSSSKFQSLVSKASKDPAPTVPWNYLSWDQLLQKLKDRTNECRQYRKKVSFVSWPQT